MPSKTIYIHDSEYLKLCKEPNPSKLIQELLKRYYGELDKKVDEQKPPAQAGKETEPSRD